MLWLPWKTVMAYVSLWWLCWPSGKECTLRSGDPGIAPSFIMSNHTNYMQTGNLVLLLLLLLLCSQLYLWVSPFLVIFFFFFFFLAYVTIFLSNHRGSHIPSSWMSTLVAALPGRWHYRASVRTGRPGVSTVRVDGTASLTSLWQNMTV